jgi:acyl carrier protein
VGAVGELYLSGDGVALGYLGRPGLTAAAFVADPFTGDGARMYRTGDLARLGSGDLLEFGGRRDRQVKGHGFRVELGEVEAALARHPAVRQAAVVPLTGGAGVDGLLGYAAVEPSQVDPTELLGYLRHQIPEYMVPRRLVCLAGLPLNANGKVDYGRLPAVAESEAASAAPAVRTPARTDTERRVAALVAAALGLPEVGLEDDIFDLGAHSLLVVNLATAIASELGVDLRLRDIFLTPTVAGIVAAVMAVPAGTTQTPVTRADRTARRRAAPTQREQPQPIRGGIDV